MKLSIFHGSLPKIGIRPTIDGRLGGVRESLEKQTMDQAKAGDVVVVKGVVRTDRDFGAGYAYKVLIEEATLQK